MHIGIDAISFYTSNYYLDLRTLANFNGTPMEKYCSGIGQEKMGVAAPDEDIVTLAANAAQSIIENCQSDSIKTILVATETSIDQSKSAGIYIHSLLGIHPSCRVIELKQACYSATAALQMGCALVRQNHKEKVLVIASDIARYELNSPGESTQGCGAVAMLICENPALLTIDLFSGLYTNDIMDFWRPNYQDSAIVDGKYSTKMYLQALKHCWKDYIKNSSLTYEDIEHFCYHSPFSRMAEKANKEIYKLSKSNLPLDTVDKKVEYSLNYNRIIGNSYTASLYIALTSLLENHPSDLSNNKIGLFSYGSGCVAEFFSCNVVEGYKNQLFSENHKKMLYSRKEIDHSLYIDFYNSYTATSKKDSETTKATKGRFRLKGTKDHQRIYTLR